MEVAWLHLGLNLYRNESWCFVPNSDGRPQWHCPYCRDYECGSLMLRCMYDTCDTHLILLLVNHILELFANHSGNSWESREIFSPSRLNGQFSTKGQLLATVTFFFKIGCNSFGNFYNEVNLI